MRKYFLLLVFFVTGLILGGDYLVSASPKNCPGRVVAGPLECPLGAYPSVEHFLMGDGVKLRIMVPTLIGPVPIDTDIATCPLDITCI